jgi:Na+/H+ antiporter NhaD/arsenite permease-like protein
MEIAIVSIFLLGYGAIIFEHNINLNKTASALLTGVLCWTVLVMTMPAIGFFSTPHIAAYQQETGLTDMTELYHSFMEAELGHHLAEIAQILFFLMGAMTIVELVDAHGGFRIITDKIKTKNTVVLLWIVAILAFFLSAVLDNLTTSIVMVAMLRKLISEGDQRKFFAGIVVIAANAGGAWSPMGDVTTTMLWIGGQVTTANIISMLIVPSLVCMIIPLLYLSFSMRNTKLMVAPPYVPDHQDESESQRNIMFFAGLGGLIFVPIFKTITHLPPYMGMMMALGIVWVVSEIVNSAKDEEIRKPYSVAHALSKIDSSSMLFFLGILLAIGSLQSLHLLTDLAHWMNEEIGNLDLIVVIIGMASAVIDNVPLVAASMGMYDLAEYPVDDKLWEFLAYCAGTGGSILIIGSAAGIAVMGMEKIDFMWYLKKIGFLALIGYLAGALTYIGIFALLHG